MPSIVVLSITETVAPAPATLQECACVISQGGTVTNPFTGSLITQPSDLVPLLTPAVAITGMSWASGLMTVNTSTPHTLPSGETVLVDIIGSGTAALNASWLMTVVSNEELTFALATSPTIPSVLGTIAPHSVAEITNYVANHFSMGYTQAIFVLELGPGDVAHGVASLTTYLGLFPNTSYTPRATGFYYIYAIPKYWDANPAFLTLARQYLNPAARTYFAVTTTLGTYTNYQPTDKSMPWMIESPILSARPASVAVSAASWVNNFLTMTVPEGTAIQQGEWFQLSGATPSTLNGWYQAKFITATAISVYVPFNPGTITAAGTILGNYFANAGAPTTEFSIAAMVWIILNWNPSDTNKAPPLSYTFAYGVTPFPTMGMGPTIQAIYAAHGNIIGTGAEGGISDATINWGFTPDGNVFNWWYAVDWCAIQGDLQISNAIINNSNNKINPFYYDQNGINVLEGVLAGVFSQANKFGLVLYPPIQLSLDSADLSTGLEDNTWTGFSVVNAIPFITYVTDNPSDFPAKVYRGFSVVFTPNNPFLQVQLNYLVSGFANS